MERRWLNLRIDISQLDATAVEFELNRIFANLTAGVVDLGLTIAPVYDSAGQFLGLWKTFEGEEVPAYEMTTEEPLRR